MHLASIYFIVKDFKKSITFYEKLLQMPVTTQNMDRFAMFQFEGNCIALMNGYFDSKNPDKVVHRGNMQNTLMIWRPYPVCPIAVKLC